MRFERDLSPLQITLVYIVFAMVALLISDVLFVLWIDDPALLRQVQTVKGGVEILLTAGLIYILTRAGQRSLARTNTQLERRTQELHILQRLFRHNSRNDINLVRGRAEWLLKENADTETTPHLEAIVTSSNRIVTYVEKSRRINELVDEESAIAEHDLVDIVDSSLDQLTDYVTDVDVSRETPSSARANSHRLLEFAVFEVMDNAVTHNDSAPPALEVTIEETTDWVVLHVADNGPGIPEDERTVLREEAETPLIHSSGIGLWLAYWTTTRSGGEFQISDNDPSGSVVTMRLPHA